MTLGNGGGSIPKHPHRPALATANDADAAADARCVYSLTRTK